MPLRLTETVLATDAAMQKEVFAPGKTAIIDSNENVNDTMELVKYLWKSGLFHKSVTKRIKIEANEQEGGFLSMLLETLVAGVLWDMLAVFWAGEGTIKAGQDF